MILTYDPEADAIYVAFQPRHPGDVARTDDRGNGRHVDYDADGNLLGVEILDVSHGIDLESLPRAEDIRNALSMFPHPPRTESPIPA